ncbi:HlyD family secretion protein [Streptosporangium sp. NBC_01469]|uniref:HlyD family secretion protein n=1 Tax=Streptosporangium sp. NBC_01469 TaxID=2903898 RepID=UPI002E2C5FEF|nr:HlyD family secretion protein [Streptosporangium sp. NBC_01469]
MGTANAISMIAQPVHGSYLCFEIGGILNTFDIHLGDTVKAIPYDKLAYLVKASGTIAGDPSRLVCDTNGVLSIIQPFLVASLRNEDRKASLDSAVNSRQNIYFSKHANASSLISTIKGSYDKGSPASNPNLLDRLSDLANQQLGELDEAYRTDERTGVVKSTSSCTVLKTGGKTGSNRASKFYQESVGLYTDRGTEVPRPLPIPWEGHPDHMWSGYQPRFTSSEKTGAPVTTGVNFEETKGYNNVKGTQSTNHVDYEYRTPYIEAHARALRAQISLTNQQFAAYMFSQNIPYLETIFANELGSVDNDVYQLQIALLRSFLISPIEGVVTGVYKGLGEAVNAGEPVIRVEDNSLVHLLANLVHVGPILIGATATLTTMLAGAGNPTTSLNGTVVSARGLDSGTRWEVIIRVNNVDAGGQYVLPLGYVFDPEYTDISIA